MDLSVTIGGRILQNPVGVASGTFGYGSEYEELIDLAGLGALYTKAVTPEPRPGNDIPRIIETPGGLLNSIGLANAGCDAFVEKKLPYLETVPCSVIVNVAGNIGEDYRFVIDRLEEADRQDAIWGYEINLSCPNVKVGGMALGTSPTEVERVTALLRGATERPLIVKLSPNVTDIGEIARGAEAGGADAVSCINTLVGMLIDTKELRTVLPGGTGGLSGPAILPVGLAMVHRVSRTVSIPVIGLGGIFEPDHAIQYLLAGAAAVQIGTANFVDPTLTGRVLEEVLRFAEKHGLSRMDEFSGLIEGKR
ncbi:MAG: dihydroorotate dehydrogenase [Spirochaetaceae bacterium]